MIGRRSVPPSVVAVVMVLQRLEGLSDQEAVEPSTFDARWRYAAGVGGWDGTGLHCRTCPLAQTRTKSKSGRRISTADTKPASPPPDRRSTPAT